MARGKATKPAPALAGAPHHPKMPQSPHRAQSPALHCCREGKIHTTIPDLPLGCLHREAPDVPVDAEPRNSTHTEIQLRQTGSTPTSLQGHGQVWSCRGNVTVKGTRDEPKSPQPLSLDLPQTHLEVPTCAGLHREQTIKTKITLNPTDRYQWCDLKRKSQ